MKTLLLLRHAKSSWKDAALADHDRPLKKRGLKAAPRMGRWMSEQNWIPDQVLCSTATRARETLYLVSNEFSKKPPTEFLAELYEADPARLVGVLCGVSEPTETVLVIGHNPGLEQFLEQITGQAERLPTAAVTRIELDLTSWSELTAATRGRLIAVARPRDLFPE